MWEQRGHNGGAGEIVVQAEGIPPENSRNTLQKTNDGTGGLNYRNCVPNGIHRKINDELYGDTVDFFADMARI